MRFGSIALALVVVVGCGGRTLGEPGDAGIDGPIGDDVAPDSGDDDSGIRCGSPPPSCIPVNATTCTLECNTCSCEPNGEWACTQKFCPPPVCPSSPPALGAYCANNGERCTYGTGCPLQCACDANQWTCLAPPCPPPVCPPPPATGACNNEGMTCQYGAGCGSETCECSATPQGVQWICYGTGCIDAGPPIDAGH